MTHSKLDKAIDEILVFPQPGESYDDYMDVHLLDGELMCYHITEQGKKKLKQALLEAFEQSLPADRKELKWSHRPDFSGYYNQGYNAYRNEAIKVIRGK